MTNERDDFFNDDSGMFEDGGVLLNVERSEFLELRESHCHTVIFARHLQRVLNFCLFLILLLGAGLIYSHLTLSPTGEIHMPQGTQTQQESKK